MRVSTDIENIFPTCSDMGKIYIEKYKTINGYGWSPSLRKKYNYFTPDDYYEALISNLVKDGMFWADVGCGRDIFPNNIPLAEKLSILPRMLLGIDPSENIFENKYISERFQGLLEQYEPKSKFDLVTLCMVAEHIASPNKVMRKLACMIKIGGLAVIYTPNRWSPVSIMARYVPFGLHHLLKNIAWKTDEQDTFPVEYKINTRYDLRSYFERYGFEEIMFSYIDDCRTTTAFRKLNAFELNIRMAFSKLNVVYPENCLLAVYRRTADYNTPENTI